jgi:hypothetical protein
VRTLGQAPVHQGNGPLDHGRIRALGDELSRLMKEQSESLEAQAFIGINQQELQRQEQRLKRIREVSADLIAGWNEFIRSSTPIPEEENKGGGMAERASVTLPGKVEKIIERPSEPKKAEISVEPADPLYKEIRIENTLEDDDGQEVELKPGAEVDVKVEAEPEAVTPKKPSRYKN